MDTLKEITEEEEEVWKVITGFEHYLISSLGRVKSLKCKREKILKLAVNTCGYCICTLHKKNVKYTVKIHKLVAIAFLNHIPCGNLEVIDHINEIKTDNRAVNLQILTQSENLLKAYKIKKTQLSRQE